MPALWMLFGPRNTLQPGLDKTILSTLHLGHPIANRLSCLEHTLKIPSGWSSLCWGSYRCTVKAVACKCTSGPESALLACSCHAGDSRHESTKRFSGALTENFIGLRKTGNQVSILAWKIRVHVHISKIRHHWYHASFVRKLNAALSHWSVKVQKHRMQASQDTKVDLCKYMHMAGLWCEPEATWSSVSSFCAFGIDEPKFKNSSICVVSRMCRYSEQQLRHPDFWNWFCPQRVLYTPFLNPALPHIAGNHWYAMPWLSSDLWSGPSSPCPRAPGKQQQVLNLDLHATISKGPWWSMVYLGVKPTHSPVGQ